MLEQFAMPTLAEVQRALLRALLKHGGVIKEFGSGKKLLMRLPTSLDWTNANVLPF